VDPRAPIALVDFGVNAPDQNEQGLTTLLLEGRGPA
jgi:hypothetical protein